MNRMLEDKVEQFESRWNELNSVPKVLGVAGRRYDPVLDEIKDVPPDQIEIYGDVTVYPSPAFPGWYDVKSGDQVVVSFAGELAHRNAVAFAKRWSRES